MRLGSPSPTPPARRRGIRVISGHDPPHLPVRGGGDPPALRATRPPELARRAACLPIVTCSDALELMGEEAIGLAVTGTHANRPPPPLLPPRVRRIGPAGEVGPSSRLGRDPSGEARVPLPVRRHFGDTSSTQPCRAIVTPRDGSPRLFADLWLAASMARRPCDGEDSPLGGRPAHHAADMVPGPP